MTAQMMDLLTLHEMAMASAVPRLTPALVTSTRVDKGQVGGGRW